MLRLDGLARPRRSDRHGGPIGLQLLLVPLDSSALRRGGPRLFVRPLRAYSAIAAFQAAEEDGFEEGAIDEGFGVRTLREAFKKFGISVQRYWNGAVS